MSKEIKLTKGMVCIVDDDDFEWLSQWKWQAHKSKNKYYAVRKRVIRMHREIAKTPDGMQCDHIDGNTLDNRKSNLRNCEAYQNAMNRGANTNSKTGAKGVCLDRGRYRARITFRGKKMHVGYFKTIDAAIEKRRIVERKLFGDFLRFE